MNRETEAHFSNVPMIDKPRSKFNRSGRHLTTMNTGKLYPIMCEEVLPGDTVKMNLSSLMRMTTPIFPVMDNCYADYYFFYVPSRLLWNHYNEFWGENNTTHWEQPIEYEIPKINAPTGGWKKGSLADHLGIPTNVELKGINHLPFRGYAKICNDWFRDENLKDPCMITMDETTVTGKNHEDDYDYVTDIEKGADMFVAAKYHDYFTSALPSAQKGPETYIPIGGMAPVGTMANIGLVGDFDNAALQFKRADGMETMPDSAILGIKKSINSMTGEEFGELRAKSNSGSETLSSMGFYPRNLATDLSYATGISINQLRQSFAIQRFYEAQARGGTRMIEFLKNIWGVTSPDARLQRSEYLGGKRVPINMAAIYQNSATDTISPQGNAAGYSVTADSDDMFTHSFVESGYLYGLCVIRTDHTYQQGLNRLWSRKKWSDFYVPQFANLGEMAILNKEIYAQGTDEDEEAFGYQEAWADYRYMNNIISGAFRSNYETTLDSWHYGDDYDTLPTLSAGWIDETQKNVDRTLTVQSSVEDQFLCDFYFDSVWTREMPVYSVPGLIDHH